MIKSLKPNLRPIPDFTQEDSLFQQGYSMVAGLDEVGRGTLAGPVVAGLAIFEHKPYDDWVGMIRDSKQMSPSQREYVIPYLESAALALEIGVSSSIEVDNLGIVSATRLAMKRAINSLTFLPQYLLLDAFPLPDISIPQKAIIRGDSICFSIASASIVAKVRRDKMMEEYDILYPGYGFVSNKGYGTRQHMDGLKELGPSPIHRKTFSPLKEMLGF